MPQPESILLYTAAFVFLLIFAALSIRIVLPYEKGLVVRLGRYQRTAESGLIMIVPFVESLFKVDMWERVLDVPPQDVITKDNVAVTVDAVIYAQIGDLELDQCLVSREQINAKLRTILDDATDKWGVRVGRVEIQRIEPPADVTSAMHRQMKAERDKRALVLEAEGQRQSAILQAEGVKQSKILNADGEAGAIERVYRAIHTGNPTNDLIAIRYLETRQKIAEGSANKVFIPYEATGLLGSLGAVAELFKGGTRPSPPPAATGAGDSPIGPAATPSPIPAKASPPSPSKSGPAPSPSDEEPPSQ